MSHDFHVAGLTTSLIDIDPKTDWRKPDGVLETALALHRKENDHDDHF